MTTTRQLNRPNPYASFNFEVAIGGILVGGFQEASGLTSSISIQAYQEGGQNAYQHQLVGPTDAAENLVLKRGLNAQMKMWYWYQRVHQDQIADLAQMPIRVPVVVFLNDRQGNKVRWWLIRDAIPVKWSGPQLVADASGNSAVAYETLELAHHGIFIAGQGTGKSSLSRVNKVL
ncbi:MAG: phage tail protein [Chloroflexota bacterium]